MKTKSVIIAITGASGIMGGETVKRLLKDPSVKLRLLLRRTKRGRRCADSLRKYRPDRVKIRWGDVRNYEDCRWLCFGADYIIHMAAIIPPVADHDWKLTLTTNRDGTDNMIRAAKEAGRDARFIHISTVAIYGNRNEKHPWGRVGDPLLTSAFDVYGQSKTIAEYHVIESGLKYWAVLRQTGVLYDNILMNNISDGLMFHTPWNMPVEWVSAKDSGLLLSGLVKKDREGRVKDFWKKVYNIGGGASTRQSGYETFADGFALIGGSVESFFKPNWNCTGNFHCMWFSDSDELEEKIHFRTQSCDEFWKWFENKHSIYKTAKLIPASWIRSLAIERLFNNNNAPIYWLKHNDRARIQAYFGGMEEYKNISSDWKEISLFSKSDDYENAKTHTHSFDLDHGYDEKKKELDIEDMKAAARFRGGECLTDHMSAGDLYTKLEWRCHEGHVFKASPYAVIKAGHWCPACCHEANVWRMDAIAKHSPFHAQIWDDSHSPDKRYIYTLKDGRAEMEAYDG